MAKGKVESTKSGNWGSFGGNGHMAKFDGTGTQTPGQSSQEGSGPRRGGVAAKGGNNAAFYSSAGTNKSYAGTQTPGQSASCPTGGDQKFASGGKTHMHGHSGSQRAIAGQSSR
jgi:hypothetical protein